MPSVAIKRFLRVKFIQHFVSDLHKKKSMQTSGSMFAERYGKAKKTKYELELIKSVDCFLDDHGNYDSNSGPFRTKCLEQTLFSFTVSRSNECSQRIKILVKNAIPNRKN